MRILFIHQNFPGQFLTLAPALAARGHDVLALTCREGLPSHWSGVRIFHYNWAAPKGPNCHRWLSGLNAATHRAEAVFRAASALKSKGFQPDVIVAHTGWGEAMFLGDLWPKARIAAFSELWYQVDGGDLGFDPEFPPKDPDFLAPRLRMKNAVQAVQIEQATALFTATRWQAESYPLEMAVGMKVLHEGVDTKRSSPDREAVFEVPGGPRLSCKDKVVSFVNRNLEPLRGFHVFMRALPALLTAEPDARVVIVGGTGVSYGIPPKCGGLWKDVMLAEIAPKLTDDQLSRVHFVGQVPHAALTRLFQITRAHVYLTYPFVTSWSLLEAMSCGAPIVGCTVGPVEEFVTSEKTGLLVDFFDTGRLTTAISRLLADDSPGGTLGAAARNEIIQHYDLTTICLPKRVAFVERFAGGASETLVGDPKLARAG